MKLMRAPERRKAMAAMLLTAKAPITGSALAAQFKVSRQIIVQDISTLKSMGYGVVATHYGYVLHKSPLVERVFKVKHLARQTEDELNCVVDFGATVANVFVEHEIYGKLSAPLNVFTRNQVRQFMENVRSGKSSELMNITGGVHYHTVRAETEEILDEIEKVLRKKNYLIEVVKEEPIDEAEGEEELVQEDEAPAQE